MRLPDDETREAPYETPEVNRHLSRPRPRDDGAQHEPAQEGFVAGLTRAPATPQRDDPGETRRSLERRLHDEADADAGEGLW